MRSGELLDKFIEVRLKTPDDFLKVKETLTRIGVADSRSKKLWQSCHILHKKTRYYIVHFKQLLELDGKPSTFSVEDSQRLNRIASLLHDWGLVEVLSPEKIDDQAPLSLIKVVSFREKSEWELIPKYKIGARKNS